MAEPLSPLVQRARFAALSPASTYRLHLRGAPHETLPNQAQLLDYIRDLGADAVYLSPILQAVPGSTHAYDVTDPTSVDEARGGEAGFIEYSDRAQEVGLRLILDVVPNHMGVQEPRANPAWWSVLRDGAESPYAAYFDVDWDFLPIRVPVLSSQPDEDLDQITVHDEHLTVLGVDYPIAPGTGGGSAREILSRQHYRLTAHDDPLSPTFRRFFNVNGLAAIRPEVPKVYQWALQRYLDWISEGRAHGLRLDHLDGLADPAGFLAQLQQAHPGLWVLPEIVLDRGESLPPSFACAGTTGYDVMAYLDRIIIDPAGEDVFISLDEEFVPGHDSIDEVIRAAREQCVDGPISADVARLTRMAPEIPDAHLALREILVAFSRYRTFAPEDLDELHKAVDIALARRPDLRDAITAIAHRLGDAADPLCIRFQQTSGSMMGIAVESWVFFRFGRLTSLAEVGASPLWWSTTPQEMHDFLTGHEQQWPLAMTTLATHDTKRGEDVRARLAVLTEVADEWADAVRRWFAQSPPESYLLGTLLVQALLGAAPVSDDDLTFYVSKAARELGIESSWLRPDIAFEDRALAWAQQFVGTGPLAHELDHWVRRITPYGYSNSLTIKALQLAGPGVPDVYRGSEAWNLDLVDPLNRKTVDYDRLRALLARADADKIVPVDDSAVAKVRLVSTLLRLRRDQPELFHGYRPIYADGPAAEHAVGFERSGLIVIGTRLPVGLERRGGWDSTHLTLAGSWHDELTGATWSGQIPLRELLRHYPVAVLRAVPAG